MKKKQFWLAVFLFLFSATSLQAWYEKTHAYAARLVMELIQKIDRAKLYEELYSQPFLIELGRGAWREDFDPPIEGNARAFRHFFDPDLRANNGSKFHFYFYLWTTFEGEAVKEPPSFHYEDALSWARNGARTKNNPFHWEGAIEAYDYTTNSRQEAFYRLGHVIHLLVDMSEPDHSSNMPHPGSGKIIPDTIDEMFGAPVIKRLKKLGSNSPSKTYKPTIKTEALKSLLNMLYLKFRGSDLEKKERLTGFEGLIEENVDHRLVIDFFLNEEAVKISQKPLLTQAVPPIAAQNIQKAKELDDYFIQLGRISKKAQQASGLPLALGCKDIGSLLTTVFNYEPFYILPTIDTNDPSAQAPYYNLAWPLITKSVEYSAGLMEDFHDIVNHPPYVQSLSLVQAGGGSYRARWEDILETRPTGRTEESFYDVKYRGFQSKYDYVKERKLVTNLNGTFMTGIPIEISIRFGSDAYAVEERIDPSSVVVRMGGETASGGMTGPATWEGRFLPKVGADMGSREFKLEIGAKDLHAHFPRTGYPDKGYLLDTDPATPAKASSRPPYDWLGYTQGPDENHSISVFTEPVDEPEKKEEIIESGGGCPIPPGAQISESNIIKGYEKLIGNLYRNVGPYLRWHDSSRTRLSVKTCYDTQGRQTGTRLEWYADGTLSRRAEYEAGELNGADIRYHRNGKIRFETQYSKGEKSGSYKSYAQDGSLMASGTYSEGKKTGIWKSYDGKGRLTAERSYSEDQLNGPSVSYQVQEDAQPGEPLRISSKYEYKNNQENGTCIRYFEDGSVYQTIEYREGKKDGMMKEYYSSGQLKLEIPFRNDKRHGTMVEYARNGEIMYKWILENGDPVRKLDKDGNVIEVYKKKDR
jgi:antitoxin component YwqK of YwqJK toxin-antitoxin module